MLFDLDSLISICEPVVVLARDAGADVMAVYARGAQGNQHVGMTTKDDDSPVTAADMAAHRRLDAGLSAIRSDIPVVSEENEASFVHRVPWGCFWLIDPVDGTREFLARTDEFTVNVALVIDGRARLGVVYAPALEQMYWGVPGAGAWRSQAGQSEPIRVAPYPRRTGQGVFERPLRILASRNHINQATSEHIRALQPQTLVPAGSSLKFCRIAEGAADYYPRLGPTSEWDTAAAQAVVEAAGGQVNTMDGHALTYGKPDKLNPHFLVTGQPRPT